MTQISNNYGVNPVYNSQPTSGVQPASYNPQVQAGYAPDQYRQTQPVQGGGGIFSNANNKPYVTKQTVVTAAALAVGGFMIGGPIGGIIGAIVGILLGIIMNVMKMKKDEKAAQQGQGSQPIPAQGYGMNQQQMQQMQMQQKQIQQQQVQQAQPKRSWF